MKLKYPESILALNVANKPNNPGNIFRPLEEEYFTNIRGQVLDCHDETLKINVSDLIIANRTMLETNENFRQIITYFQFRKHTEEGRKVTALYQRVKGSGEDKLLGNYSVGFGGHVEATDVRYCGKGCVDLINTLVVATKREIIEELKFYYDDNIEGSFIVQNEVTSQLWDSRWNTYVWDHSNDVGRVHLGILNTITIPNTATLACNEDSMIFIGFKTNEELLNPEIYEKLEHWSKLVVEYNHQMDNAVEVVPAEELPA